MHRSPRAAVESLESRRLLASIHVASFGAVPNDTLSDTAAIQNAINASAPGDTIEFASGRYDIGRVYLSGDRTYRGTGSTTIRSNDIEFGFDVNGNAKDMVIRGFRFEKAGVVLSRGQLYSNARIVENTFADMDTNAIKVTIKSDRLTIERNVFRDIRGYGALAAWDTNRLSYSYNRMIDCVQGAHVLGPLNDCRFVNNYMTGLKVMGLEIQRDSSGTSVSHNLLVEGNILYDWRLPNGGSFGLSVVAEGGQNTIIRGNYLRNSIAPGSTWNPDLRGQGYTFGPAIEAGFETGVVENNITGGPTQWTAHVGAAGVNMLVRNNKFFGASEYGPYICPWPSIYGTGTFIDQNNSKDPVKSNMPAAPSIHGDVNGDGRVNLEDFNIISTNFGRSNASLAQGDLNGDGSVNLADFNILTTNFGRALWP